MAVLSVFWKKDKGLGLVRVKGIGYALGKSSNPEEVH